MTTFKGKLLLLTIIFSISCFAQTGFLPLTRDAAREKSLVDAITLRYKNDIAGLSGPYKKYLAEIYKERYEMTKKMFDDNAVIVDEDASAYLSSVANEILKANPGLNASELRILFSRAWWANASNMGEGTLLFNIGLFHRLENEAQAAFVICHEMAHYYLNHSNNSILNYVNTVYSDEFQKKLKTIQKTDYRQNQLLENLAKSLTFRNRRHSREFEQAADSMAIELMKNTGYDLNESLSCLALLDSADKDKYDCKLNLETHFNFPAFPFKTAWMASSSLAFAIAKEKDSSLEDSLKTHPDCKVRIEKLRPAVARYSKDNSKKFIVSSDKFWHFRQQFDYEILEFCFEHNEISRCLYYALEMLDAFPDKTYLHATIGRCLNEIYSRQKAHELGKIVDLPMPEYTEEYNKLLRLIQNIRLREVASLCYYYMKQYQQTEDTDKRFAAAWQTATEHFNNQ